MLRLRKFYLPDPFFLCDHLFCNFWKFFPFLEKIKTLAKLTGVLIRPIAITTLHQKIIEHILLENWSQSLEHLYRELNLDFDPERKL